MTTIAVTGATGQLGRLALAALAARGAPEVVALARSPARAADLGFPVRAFDYARPNPLALRGVEVLVLISSNDAEDRAGQHKAVIAAARSAGVGRIVYTSILKGVQSPLILAQDHIATERELRASRLAVTILRNGWYSENFTAGLAAAVQQGRILGAAGAGKVSSAARRDFAEAIAVTALDPTHAGRVYELAGDTAHTGADLAAAVSALAGRPVAYVSLPQADYARALQGLGLPAGLAAAVADAEAMAAKGALFDDSRTLSRLIGRPTTPLADTLRAALG